MRGFRLGEFTQPAPRQLQDLLGPGGYHGQHPRRNSDAACLLLSFFKNAMDLLPKLSAFTGNQIEPRFSAAEASRAPAVARLDPQALLAQLGSEVASTLSSALERVTTLSTSGRIDREGLRRLREEIDLARRAGIMGQQVVRLSSGRVKLARERLDVTALLREALVMRGREISARSIEVRQELAPALVISDATLLFSLLETLLDWCFAHSVSRVDLRLDVEGWPTQAKLAGGFLHCHPDQMDNGAKLDTMAWRLLQQTSALLNIRMQRRQHNGRTEFSFEFPDTVVPTLAGAEISLGPQGPAAEDHSTLAYNSQPLAGRHIMVLAARREVRNLIRETLRSMGLRIDFVATVEEALQLFTDGLPHGVIYEAGLTGERFEQLRSEALAELPGVAFIQIAEQGKAFEVLNIGGHQVASVGRDAILDALPSALMFELSRHG
jgi:CheY-like chemotaxis protein